MLRTHFLCLTAAAAPLLFAAQARTAEPAKPAEKPLVEVVFCLDTTGSMGGLIDAAKRKIWAISNQIATGKPTPRLKVGLIGYRDRGDEYVTKRFDLTDDLDDIHTQLMQFRAGGGGDTPESVNQALHEAVAKMSWTEGKNLKIIFLVGDAPPKDYPGDVKYPEICQMAVKKNIIINTVQCGNMGETKTAWEKICHLAEGSFVQIDQQGGPIVVVATPFDDDLAKINGELSKTTVVFGAPKQQQAGEAQIRRNLELSKEVAADRASFYANSGRGASYDLLENIKNKTVKLEELKKEELPVELRDKTLDQQRTYLSNLDKQRNELNQRARELDQKRNAFIAQKQAEDAKNSGRDSFDNQVLQMLRRQASRNNIEYGTIEEKK